MSDRDIARSLMYNQDDEDEKPKTPKKINEFLIRRSAQTIILESGGIKHQVPSMQVFNDLLREYNSQRNELRDQQVNIKRLTETVKRLDSALRNVEMELTNKADIYGE